MLRTDRQGRRKSEPLSSRRSKNKPDTVRLFLAWPTAARDAPGPAKGGMVFFPLYGEKNTIPPFGKGRKSLFFFFAERKRTKKKLRAIAKIESKSIFTYTFAFVFFALRFFQKAGQSRLTVSAKKSCRGDGARYRAEKNFSLRNAERTDMCSCFFSHKSRWTPWNSYDTIKVTNQKGGT